MFSMRGGGGVAASPDARPGPAAGGVCPRGVRSVRVSPLVVLVVTFSFALPTGSAALGPDAGNPTLAEENAVSIPVSDSVRVRLELSDAEEAGADVPITLRVVNPLEEPVDLYLTGRPVAFDMIVADEDGVVLWRRLEGETIAMALRIETLAPGASLEFTHRWDQRTNDGDPVPPGTYTVRGELLTEDGPLAAPPATLRIVP